MDKVLVTGGAGYIGSHLVDHLVQKGYAVTVFDNLSQGHRDAVHPDAEFVRGDLRDWFGLREFIRAHKFDGVFHLAGRTLVGESMERPFLYFRENVDTAMDLVQLCIENDIGKFIFSSTANVYGNNKNYLDSLKGEFLMPAPSSPYGESKLMVERMLYWMQSIHGFQYTVLRYFNAAGAHSDAHIGEDHTPETHLIPNAIKAALSGQPVYVHGSSFPTKDGTAVRDYVHVSDLARGHELAYSKLNGGNTYNLGSSMGFSVREVLMEVAVQTGMGFPILYGAERKGDPPTLIADITKVGLELGWKPHYHLPEIIASATRWHLAHPNGYGRSKEKRFEALS